MSEVKKNGNFQENFVPTVFSISYPSFNLGGPRVPLRDHRKRKQRKKITEMQIKMS